VARDDGGFRATLDFGLVTHPTLGAPPRDLRAGYPAAAERLTVNRARLGGRALEVAVDRDPTIRDRHGELGMRRLLRDTEPMIDRLALALAANDPGAVAAWADWVVPLYRRRKVPMDDLVQLCEGLRLAVAAVLGPAELEAANAALDEAIRVLRWNRRIAGDARKRNRLLTFLYRGA
jgi:hypothetical protein